MSGLLGWDYQFALKKPVTDETRARTCIIPTQKNIVYCV